MSLVNTPRDTDLGFRVFKLSESNYKPWKGVEEKTAENYSAQMQTYIDALVTGWKKDDVIFEVALKEGLGLVIGIQHEDRYTSNEIYRVKNDEKEQSFWICLDDKIRASTVKQLEVTKDDTFVCRDIAIDDTMAANLALSCRLKTI